MMDTNVAIAVIGGSGFYSLIENAVEVKVDTPYGPPSDKISIGSIAGTPVAFLPRHGKTHHLPPHMIPYRANISALKQLGVNRIIGPNCVGSLQASIRPGSFVVCDQFIDRTSGRRDTFHDGPSATHISSAEPYCKELRELAVTIAKDQGVEAHDGGTCVVIQGPRFSSQAESAWYTRMGWDVVNMTQYPECVLALEQEMCYVNISLVTDYDAGVVAEAGVEPVSADEVGRVLVSNNDRVRKLIYEMVARMPDTRDCKCATALRYARLD